MVVRSRVLKTLWLFFLVLVPPAAAQSVSSRIVLSYDPTSEEQRRALAAVRAHLRGLPVEIVTETVEQKRDLTERLAASGALAISHTALGTFSIEKGTDRSILVFLTEPGGSATLVRRLPASELSARVAIEQAAIVVRSLVEALLEGGRLGVAAEKARSSEATDSTTEDVRPQATPETTPTDRSAPEQASTSDLDTETPDLDTETPDLDTETPDLDTEPAAFVTYGPPPRFFLALGYAGARPGGGLGWQSGVAVGAHWFLPVHAAYLGVRYTLLPEFELDAGSARVSIVRRPAELMLGVAVGSWVLANAELSVIAERSVRKTVSTTAAFQPTRSSTHWDLGLGPRVGAILAPWPVLHLAVRGGADFLLTQTNYATDEETVLVPTRVRPRLEFELGVGVW